MTPPQAKFAMIAVETIDRGRNVRIDETGLDQLVASIRKHGVLQPITVVPNAAGDRVECLFGHRRLAAARVAGLSEMPCLLRERGTEATRVLTQLAENRDRRDMSKLEEAIAYDDLRKLGLSQQQIADSVGATQADVSQRLLLLKYPEVVQRAVHNKMIGITDALSMPIELANATDGRTLAAQCRQGGRHLRAWVGRQQRARVDAGLKPFKRRKRFEPMNVETALMDDVRVAAFDCGVPVVVWLERVVRSALDAHAAQSTVDA